MNTTTPMNPKPPMTRDGIDGAYALVDAVGQPVRVGDNITSVSTGADFQLLDGSPPANGNSTGYLDVRVPTDNGPVGRVAPQPFGLRWVKIIPRD